MNKYKLKKKAGTSAPVHFAHPVATCRYGDTVVPISLVDLFFSLRLIDHDYHDDDRFIVLSLNKIIVL
jgi:hypothetical protein